MVDEAGLTPGNDARDHGPTGIRNTIRELRFAAGQVTQQQLAQRVGVSRQTLNAIETGKYSPSLEVAFKIALELGRPLEQVFSYVGGSRR